MSKIKNKDTKIEIEFRKAIWKAGFRYRKNPKGYFGKPDLVLRKRKTVIFIDSCFWHGCKKHCRLPSTRKNYWLPKLRETSKEIKRLIGIIKSWGGKLSEFGRII